MDEDTAAHLISLLESIDSRLDALSEIETRLTSIESEGGEMKMKICGFKYEGKRYPGKLESLDLLSDIESKLSSISDAVNAIETHTAG